MKVMRDRFRRPLKRRAGIDRRAFLLVPLLVTITWQLVPAAAALAEDWENHPNCPSGVREGSSSFLQVYWPDSSSLSIPVSTFHGGSFFTASPGADFQPYQTTMSGDPHNDILRLPVVTKQDSLPEHDETFGIAFEVDGDWYGCVIKILDDDAPKITKVEVTSIPVRPNAYRTGESIDVTVTFDQEVEVDGTPLLSLYLGEKGNTSWRGARYHHGSGSRYLTFRYQVQPTDRDDDGIFVSKAVTGSDHNPDHGFSGRIYAKGTDVQVDYSHPGKGPERHHLVDGRPLALRTQVTSTPPGGWSAYRANQVIELSMMFDIEVEVEGEVSLALYVGMDGDNWDEARRFASYLRGSGSDTLVFGYTVQPGDMDTEGIMIAGGSIFDNFGGDGRITAKGTDVRPFPWYLGSSHQPKHKVDTEPPTIESIEIISQPGSGGGYGIGELISLEVLFTEEATVSGNPQLDLDFDGTTRQADHAPGPGRERTFADTMTFQYQVQPGDRDIDGLGIGANSLKFNGGRIQDQAGNAAGLSHDALAADPGHRVDTSPGEPR